MDLYQKNNVSYFHELQILEFGIAKMMSVLDPSVSFERALYSVKKVNNHLDNGLPYHNAYHAACVYSTFSDNWKASMGNPLRTRYIPTLAILFHDYVYYPDAKDNEEASCAALKSFLNEFSLDDKIKNMIYSECVALIMYTKNHLSVPEDAPDFVKLFVESDLAILGQEESVYMEYAKNIRREYCFVEDKDYIAGRRAFLEKMRDYRFSILQHLNENLEHNLSHEVSMLISGDHSLLDCQRDEDFCKPKDAPTHTIEWEDYAKSLLEIKPPQKGKTCIYAGSFMPITNGHIRIIEKASKVFDEVRVLIADNPKKEPVIDSEIRVLLTALACLDNSKVTVEYTDRYVAQYAKTHGVETLIRGLRPIGDFDGELQLAMANKAINPNLETIFIPCDVQDSYISSSLVREMIKLSTGKEFVPPQIYRYMRERR